MPVAGVASGSVQVGLCGFTVVIASTSARHRLQTADGTLRHAYVE